MRTSKRATFSLGLVLGLANLAAGQTARPPNSPSAPQAGASTPQSAADEAIPTTHLTEPAPSSARAIATNPNELRLNFRNAPLETVLNYLSDAAGFIIVPRTGGDLRG